MGRAGRAGTSARVLQSPSRGGSLGARLGGHLAAGAADVTRVASGNEWIVNIDFAVLNEVDIYLTNKAS